ncbi:MAG: hypothetical protein JST51_00530 [Armatimonadetes bacterium]|nr:hypothetical protein [Armatimonadota bacterium]
MVLVLVVALVGQLRIAPTVVTSGDLLKNRVLPEKVRLIGAKHRWILFGDWTASDRNDLADAAEKLARWRQIDKGLESPNAGSDSQKAMLANWKRQLEPPKTPGLARDLREIVQALPTRLFPLQDEPCGKWLKIDQHGVPDLDRRADGAVKDLMDHLATQYSDPEVHVYLLLRRIAGSMYVYVATMSFDGKMLNFESIRVSTAMGGPEEDGVANSIFGSSQSVEAPLLTNGKKFEAVPSEDFDLGQVAKKGFLSWVGERVSDPVRRKPVAMLANDADLIVFLRDGGTFEGFLANQGYREIEAGNVRVVVPEFFDEAERIRIREDLLADFSSKDDWAKTLRKVARWASESNLGSSLNLLNYIEGAFARQRRIPMLSEQIYPLLPILKDLPLQAQSPDAQTFRLFGSTNGHLGENLIHDRIGDGFSFGERGPAEQTLGCFWGAGAANQLESVSFDVRSDQWLSIPRLGPLPFDAGRLSDNIHAFGKEWETIEPRLNAEPMELLEGDAVSVTFQTTRGRMLLATYFFPRTSLGKRTFKTLPAALRDDIKERALLMIEVEKTTKRQSPPPPPRAVQ